MDIFALLFILLRPFYLRTSGQIQPSDGLLMVYFFSVVYKDICSRKLLLNLKKNMLFYIFLILAISINCIYLYYIPDKRFIMSSLYLVYIGVVVYSFDSGISRPLIDKVRYVLYINILIQFVIYFTGYGKIYYESWEVGATRYMGTFTDPNQFGFCIFIALTYAYLTKKQKIDQILFPVASFAGIYLTIQSKSLSAILGLLTLYLLIAIRFIVSKCKVNKLLVIGSLLIIGLTASHYLIPSKDFDLSQVEYTIVNRARYKIYNIIYADGLRDILRERAAEKVINYPEYFIYGAGEGFYERYYPEPINEIHSSFINLFFSYGLIPFSILLLWFKKRLGRLDGTSRICLITIMVESTFLVNYRQALFWLAWITIFYLNEKHANSIYSETSQT